MDIIYRFDLERPYTSRAPQTADEARRLLEEGNRVFAHLVRDCSRGARRAPKKRVIECDPEDLGLSREQGLAPRHSPFAAVLSCSDARVPTELIFNQGCNDLFVVRVAGNVIGPECQGSLEYAIRYLQTNLRILVVLGHSGCGAVTAAVDIYQNPRRYSEIAFTPALRSIVDRIFVCVRDADEALRTVWGPGVVASPRYRAALIEMTVSINAALAAYHLRRELDAAGKTELGVVYGVYDLVSRHVYLPRLEHGEGPREDVLLADAPTEPSDFVRLGKRLAERCLAPAPLEAAPRPQRRRARG